MAYLFIYTMISPYDPTPSNPHSSRPLFKLYPLPPIKFLTKELFIYFVDGCGSRSINHILYTVDKLLARKQRLILYDDAVPMAGSALTEV
jgi:hypothetical protein